MRFVFLIIAYWFSGKLMAQFAPAAGFSGSTAIAANDPIIRGWATHAFGRIGPQDIRDSLSPPAATGNMEAVIGPSGSGVLSLGDGGTVTLGFTYPIYDGIGYDFAVFENGFPAGAPGMAFLEFATVSVSSDGVRFVTFPCFSDLDTSVQMDLVPCDAAQVHNLAGKYVMGQGTPFDLNELRDSSGLDVEHIQWIRLTDVVGSLDPKYGTRDSRGRLINDPWPTPFPNCGFDLDAVGAIHLRMPSGMEENMQEAPQWANPVQSGTDFIWMGSPESFPDKLEVYDVQGAWVATISAHQLRLNLSPGSYWLNGQKQNRFYRGKLLVW